MPITVDDIEVISLIDDAGEIATSVNKLIERTNEVVVEVNDFEIDLGEVDDLITDDKSSVVAAVNEIVEKFNSGEVVAAYVGNLSDLNTIAKNNVVASINEVNSKIGDTNDLLTETHSSIVAAINEIFETVQTLTDINAGDILFQIAQKVSKGGDSMTGRLNIAAGVASSSTSILGLGWNDQLPRYALGMTGSGDFVINKMNASTGLVESVPFSLTANGVLTLGGSGYLIVGGGAAGILADGTVAGSAWTTWGGNASSIIAIQNKLDGKYSTNGGVLSGKMVQQSNTSNSGQVTSLRDFKFGDKTYRSWQEYLWTDGTYQLMPKNPDTDSVINSGFTLTRAGNASVPGDFTLGNTLWIGNNGAVIGSDGHLYGSAWAAWGGLGGNYRAVDNIDARITTRLASYVTYPTGGTTGQALIKNSNANNDVTWGGPYQTVSGMSSYYTTTQVDSAFGTRDTNINARLKKDGTDAMNGDLNMGGKKIYALDTINGWQRSDPFRNKVINGDFTVNQWYGTGVFTGATNGYYIDRWSHAANLSSGSVTVSIQAEVIGQTSWPSEHRNFMRIQGSSAVQATNTRGVSNCRIEYITTFSNGKATTTFWARASTNRSMHVNWQQYFGTGGSPSATVYTYIGTANLTTSWQKFTFVTDIPSVAGKTIGTSVAFCQISFTYSADGTSAGAANLPSNLPSLGNDYIDIAHVSAVGGDATSEFNPGGTRNVGEEFVLCQRYFQQRTLTYRNDMSLTTGTTIGQGYSFPGMRTTPTTTLVDAGTSGWTNVSIEFVNGNNVSISMYPSAAGPTVRQLRYTCYLDAELY